jgi:hypothetical protein
VRDSRWGLFFEADFDRVTLPMKRPARAADIRDCGDVTFIQRPPTSDREGISGMGKSLEPPSCLSANRCGETDSQLLISASLSSKPVASPMPPLIKRQYFPNEVLHYAIKTCWISPVEKVI